MNAQCIMVCSGKGGTGKSTVSVLLGACLARLGRKTLLVELDSGLRSVDIIAGVYGRTVYDIEDVLCGRCEGAKAVVPSPLYPGLSVISAPYEGGAVEAAPLGRLLTAMRPYFDFILLDTAAGMGAPFTAASTVADKALLVLTPDPVALRDGKIVADRLSGARASAKTLPWLIWTSASTPSACSFWRSSPKAAFCSWPGPTARYRPLRIPPLWPDRPWQSVCAGSASRLPFNILYSAAKDGGIYL